MKNALFIINPISGNIENKDELVDEIIQDIFGYQVSIWKTTGKDDEQKVRALLEETCPDLLMIGGGDGTIKMVVSQISNLECPILPVPFGSANGLAKCLGINDWEDSLSALGKGQVIKMDMLDINGELCLHLCDFGFNAGLIKKFEEGDERGMIAYFKNSLSQMFETRPNRYHLQVDGMSMDILSKMLVVANGQMYGTGAKINPGGNIDDGVFEIISLNPEGIQDWLSLTLGFITEDFSDLDFVKTWKGKNAQIENIDGAAFHIDGEMREESRFISVRLKENKLNMFNNIQPA
ncbi:diacylglycerol/lipid kinase family protein [Negadavirga shengliensis]|uniref:Diacylglycerol/lipid kinase family protein n=1 Tax=Negadavirga shengliensis TaxID=1389218 RepID=A0ABV9T362_9BACT